MNLLTELGLDTKPPIPSRTEAFNVLLWFGMEAIQQAGDCRDPSVVAGWLQVARGLTMALNGYARVGRTKLLRHGAWARIVAGGDEG